MQDSERRLDLGRGGQRVQKVQEEIVESLSDLIKKMEQQSNAQAQAGQGENNSNRSTGPAEDSSIKGATAPGQRRQEKPEETRRLGQPAGQAARMRPRICCLRNSPSNYRDAVEQYFKKLADRPAASK